MVRQFQSSISIAVLLLLSLAIIYFLFGALMFIADAGEGRGDAGRQMILAVLGIAVLSVVSLVLHVQ